MEKMNDDQKSLVDVHRCHICGFTAEDPGSLIVHLGSAHPTTVQPHLSRKCTSSEEYSHRQGEEVVEERKPISACLYGEGSPKTNKELDSAGKVRPVYMPVFKGTLTFTTLCNLRKQVKILNTACLIIPLIQQ